MLSQNVRGSPSMAQLPSCGLAVEDALSTDAPALDAAELPTAIAGHGRETRER